MAFEDYVQVINVILACGEITSVVLFESLYNWNRKRFQLYIYSVYQNILTVSFAIILY